MKSQERAIILLLTLFAPLLIVGGLLKWQEWQIEEQVEEMLLHSIPLEELELLQLSHEEATTLLDWEHEHEFAYHGEMYDVVKSKSSTDSVWYWCWKDDKETAMKKQWAKMKAQFAGKEQQAKKHNTSIGHWFFMGFFQERDEFSCNVPKLTSEKIVSPFIALKSHISAPPSPPPKSE